MILYQWRGAAPNFGDELNTILWPRLLPGFFDENPAIRFLGIGSVLDQRHPPEPIKLVAGSGYGGYERKPCLDRNWIVHWVRGPRTAATLGLPRGLALGDPASLLPQALGLSPADGDEIGFMPHFESAARGNWQQAAEIAGVRLIDPRDPPSEILHAIRRCKLLLSEALHGVIIADALRVPWVAIQPRAAVHRAKWKDWADTMDLRPRFQSLPASALAEWAGASPLGSCHASRRWLSRQEWRFDRFSPDWLVTRAGRALERAIQAPPQLSSDAVLRRRQSQMLDTVQALSTNPLRGTRFSHPAPSRLLQPGADSAYQLRPTG